MVNTSESEKPRSIAIHSLKRLLFYTDVGSQQAIIRAKVDGSDRVVLVSKLEGVTAIAVDSIYNFVYFAHAKKIEYMDLDGKNR